MSDRLLVCPHRVLQAIFINVVNGESVFTCRIYGTDKAVVEQYIPD